MGIDTNSVPDDGGGGQDGLTTTGRPAGRGAWLAAALKGDKKLEDFAIDGAVKKSIAKNANRGQKTR
jgi:hypothetical protein